MCIISDIIESVTSTKIFVIPSTNGKRQLTVYSNKVSSPDSNVMCIPVPNPHSIRFENVPTDIFNQCAKTFHKKHGCMDFLSAYYNSSYKAVIIHSVNELHNQNGFILTSDVVDYLKKTYPNYGFILCKLKKGKTSYKPLAYSHDIESSLFFPTKHYNRSIREQPLWTSFDYVGIEEKLTHIADNWDHELFSIATPTWSHDSIKGIQHTNKINWSKLPDEFNHNSSVILRCHEKSGYSPNIDIRMPFNLSLLF
jgi:hypothetical protein